MAVFAWAAEQGFAAFLEAGAMKYSLQRSKFLPEVISAMTSTFERRLDRKKVVIHIVGDVVGEPLSRFFSKEEHSDELFHRASVHLEAALRKVGFEQFNRERLGVFEEPPGQGSRLQPRFTAVALDLRTGRLVMQNYKPVEEAEKKVGEAAWTALQKEYRREKDVAYRRQAHGGPMTQSMDQWWGLWDVIRHLKTRSSGFWFAIFFGLLWVICV
eukprot:CAMPEP_0197687582 /NCGR_PEP_ID=MMETSP1338-20131121/104191_1 /TAXON_ID=43686 ORGANISM="Pelagodinium beii, Strain RCC1491" /NCGR_SAMPLE_ID=MMETSP1338 /ASSEMBLY_ACC=CAM_ASM_000754 /LENGTH=213 /DNA_ID=CAMNT_0043269697 /DNA_START=173 /DNA_END=811 /DNA_ORIENTATION=+